MSLQDFIAYFTHSRGEGGAAAGRRIASGYQFWELAVFRTVAELRAESKRSYAGLLWWIIRPLLSLAVYGVVFGLIFKVKQEHFLLFLFSGIIGWEWFSSSTQRCATSVLSNRPLMLLVKVNPMLFPVSICLVDFVKFLLGLLILLVATAIWGPGFGWSIFMLPVIILAELLLCMGAGLIVSSITPFLPDFAMILTTIMQLLMFLSGVFYRIDSLPARLRPLIALNPVAVLLEQYRLVILEHAMPDIRGMAIILGSGIAAALVGRLLLAKFGRIYTKRW